MPGTNGSNWCARIRHCNGGLYLWKLLSSPKCLLFLKMVVFSASSYNQAYSFSLRKITLLFFSLSWNTVFNNIVHYIFITMILLWFDFCLYDVTLIKKELVGGKGLIYRLNSIIQSWKLEARTEAGIMKGCLLPAPSLVCWATFLIQPGMALPTVSYPSYVN